MKTYKATIWAMGSVRHFRVSSSNLPKAMDYFDAQGEVMSVYVGNIGIDAVYLVGPLAKQETR